MVHLPHRCSERLWYGNSENGQVSIEIEADTDVVEDNPNGVVEHVGHSTLQSVVAVTTVTTLHICNTSTQHLSNRERERESEQAS